MSQKPVNAENIYIGIQVDSKENIQVLRFYYRSLRYRCIYLSIYLSIYSFGIDVFIYQ